MRLAQKVLQICPALAFNAPLGPNPLLMQATNNFARCCVGDHPAVGADELTCGIEAMFMLHQSQTNDSNNPGHFAWAIPIICLMNLHIVNFTKLCPID